VLDFVLSGESVETVIESVHNYLEVLAKQIRDGKILLANYVITKGLKKVR
jgi:DNA polymerase elongation subunit (family B)